MIIVYLKGGLGNQMFQYAMGRHLAEIHNTELKMDISAYDYDGPLEYFLGPFNVQQNFASPEEIESLTMIKQNKFQKWCHGLFHNHPKLPRTFIRENHTAFKPRILKLPDNIYLEGYWPSEKYFIDIADIIRSDFTIKTPQTGKNKELAEMIDSKQSVSIHIRRGDYVFDKQTNQTHGTCGLDYYHSCIESLVRSIAEPHFFVFSDDPEWCRNNLQVPYPLIFVSHNDMAHSYEDMRLMSQCKHNIIANSTFSWWAAWLNLNKNKLVFAPRKWFNQESRKKTSRDIIPEHWIRK